MTKRKCPVCTEPLPPSRTKPHVYCGHNCRHYAWALERRVVSLTKRAAEAQAEWDRLQQARKRG